MNRIILSTDFAGSKVLIFLNEIKYFKEYYDDQYSSIKTMVKFKDDDELFLSEDILLIESKCNFNYEIPNTDNK